eukprot:314243-Chlamydomonas_euryale.AAC.1
MKDARGGLARQARVVCTGWRHKGCPAKFGLGLWFSGFGRSSPRGHVDAGVPAQDTQMEAQSASRSGSVTGRERFAPHLPRLPPAPAYLSTKLVTFAVRKDAAR